MDRTVLFKTIPLPSVVTGWSFAPDNRHVALWNSNGTTSIVRLTRRPPEAREASAAWTTLQGRLDDATANPQHARDQVVAFRAKYPGFPETIEARNRLAKLPSPLDALDAAKIPASALEWWTVAGKKPPANLVGVFGDPRRRPGASSWQVEFSPDGKTVAGVGEYGSCVLWSAETDALLGVLRTATDDITHFRFSPDRKHLATAHRSGTVRVWDLATQKAAFAVKHDAEVWSLAYSPDGRYLASGGHDGWLKVWDSQAEEIVHSDKHPSWVRVAFAPDGKTLASFGPAEKGGLIKLWESSTWKERKSVSGLEREVGTLVFSPNGKLFATHGGDEIIRIWDAAAAESGKILPLEKEPFSGLGFSRDGSQLITGGKAVRFWSVETQKEARSIAQRGPVRCLAVSTDGTMLAVCNDDDVVRLWDLEGKEVRPPTGHTGNVSSIAFSPDDRRIATGGGDKLVRVVDIVSGVELGQNASHSYKVTSLAFSPDGAEVFAGSNHTRVVDSTGQYLRALDGGFSDVLALSRSADGQRVLGLGSRIPHVWSARTGRLERTLQITKPQPYPTAAVDLAVAPTATVAATVGGDDFVAFWDFATGKLERKLDFKLGPLQRVAFLDDGKRLVAAGQSGVLAIWRLDEKDQPGRVIKAHERPPLEVLVCPGDRQVVSSDGGVVRVWNVDSGAKDAEWTLPLPATSLALSADGRYVACGNANGTVYLFRLPGMRD